MTKLYTIFLCITWLNKVVLMVKCDYLELISKSRKTALNRFEPAREDPKWFLIISLNHSTISAWRLHGQPASIIQQVCLPQIKVTVSSQVDINVNIAMNGIRLKLTGLILPIKGFLSFLTWVELTVWLFRLIKQTILRNIVASGT